MSALAALVLLVLLALQAPIGLALATLNHPTTTTPEEGNRCLT